jgi:myo-inositol-1(or 4)-monophosphatase
MNLSLLLEQVSELAREVGAFQLKEFSVFDRNKIVSKDYNDPVSYVDKESEKMLVAGLQKILPEAGFLTEEDTINSNTDGLHWVIDPLDGTNNFIHLVPIFGISIALCDGRNPILGVVYEPNRAECFAATLGGGAFLNGKPIKVSGNKTLAKSLVATGFPYSLLGKEDNYFNIFKEILAGSHGLRRLGTAAIDLCYVACGRFDAYFEFNLNPWDILAGTLIAREAGAKVTDFNLGNDVYDGSEILTTSGFQEELQEIIKRNWLD